jgi:DNA repair exonuclease SbcCD ATPase subunit
MSTPTTTDQTPRYRHRPGWKAIAQAEQQRAISESTRAQHLYLDIQRIRQLLTGKRAPAGWASEHPDLPTIGERLKGADGLGCTDPFCKSGVLLRVSEEEVKRLRQQVADMAADKAAPKGRSSELTAALANLSRANDTIADLRGSLATQEGELLAAREDLAQAKSEAERLEAKVKRLEEDVDLEVRSVDSLREECGRLLERLAAGAESRQGMVDRVVQLERERADDKLQLIRRDLTRLEWLSIGWLSLAVIEATVWAAFRSWTGGGK